MNPEGEQHIDSGHFHAVIVSRMVHVPAGIVWEAWADPAKMSAWFSEDTVHDLSVGGRYRNGDGDQGEFLEVTPGSHLKFTWEQPDYAPGSYVMVDIRPAGDEAAEIRVEHANVACQDADDLDLGWNWSLDSLISYLETGAPIPFEEWAAGRQY
jgi:uncharacterized protein YndB with AHSA1/START domain